ncbi:hypothetical protein L7F22_053023 [Adiantum nelumboides]|nr:hypothetical protein [Adiantum nelumboides]
MEASVSKVQENVEKNVHTWAEMAKDAVDKEVKECAPWIEVGKKNKGMPSNQMEVMNATLEEEAKRKPKARECQEGEQMKQEERRQGERRKDGEEQLCTERGRGIGEGHDCCAVRGESVSRVDEEAKGYG